MNLNTYTPPQYFHSIKTIDMHTGGEPLRVIIKGFPELKGSSVLEYRQDLRKNYDDLRKTLMFEPRGHADMYGCLITPSNVADFGVIFMHNEGYSTMCGHATIALGKLAIEASWVPCQQGLNHFTVEAPCGILKLSVQVDQDKVSEIRFQNVPSYVVAVDQIIEIPEVGPVTYDLAYGGAYYAFVEANSLDLRLEPSNYQNIIRLGTKIKHAVAQESKLIQHPYEKDLSFLYGTIFIDKAHQKESHSRNVCIFADGELDRCPTGSGVSARAAIHHHRKQLGPDKWITIESIIDTEFQVRIVDTLPFGPFQAVVPEVRGTAFVTGVQEFLVDPEDPLKEGFVFR